MMRPDINYYALLGITSTATPEETVRAYRKKILEVHLDKLSPGQDSDLCYKTIEAYRVLSDRQLRAKYDIQRDPSHKAQETFIPAGYICYDVGQNQLSKRFLQSISEWKKEFDSFQSKGNGFSDNYFECFSALMGQVLESEYSENKGKLSSSSEEKEPEFFCAVCDKQFPTETHHWEQMLHPYITIFSCDNSNDNIHNGVGPLLMYFEKLLGPKLFNWEPRYLPTKLLGIWGSNDWKLMDNCDKTVARIIDFLPPGDEFSTTQEYVECIRETFLDGELSEEMYPKLACKLLMFIVENQNDQNKVVNKVQDFLFQDELMEIMFLSSVMKNYLGCDQEEWSELANEAVDNEQLEMAMLWTKIGTEFGDLESDEGENEENDYKWYNLGMKLNKLDPVLAHFCFLYQGYESQEDWNDLADDFSINKEHYAAMEYFLNCSHSGPKKNKTAKSDIQIEKLLKQSQNLLKKGDPSGSTLYKTVYYSLKVKFLLSKLQLRKRDDAESTLDSELQELIDLIPDLDHTNPLEGFRIIATTWPKAFESPVCKGIHQGTINFLRRGRLTITSFNLIIGAMHFLPEDDEDEEEEFQDLLQELTDECNEMVSRQIEHYMKTNDFDSLTDILTFVSSSSITRCLLGAEKVLVKLEEESQSALIATSPHLNAMKFLIQGTVSKVQKNWIAAMNQYQDALLCSPECMHRVLPSISKLSQDIEFHEAILSEVQSEVKGLKDCFDCEEYPEVESKSNRNSLVITDIMPQIDFGYKNSISKIQADPEKMANQPAPEENVEPPPVETNTPMVTLDKNEEAIKSGKGQGQLHTALSYIDLLKALPMPFQPGPIVMAASHFLQAMDETKDPGSLFAYRNAILQMAENLLKIDRKTQATIQHCLTHKHMLSILLSAHEKLSKAVGGYYDLNEGESESETEEGSDSDLDTGEERSKPKISKTLKSDDDDTDLSSEEQSDSEEKQIKNKKHPKPKVHKQKIKPNSTKTKINKVGTDLIKTSEAHLISRFLKNVVTFPKIEPLANIPTLNCSDLVYVETLGNSFLSQFCSEKVGQKYQSLKIPKHLHAYTHFVEVWKGRSQLTDFFTARYKAMEELLALNGWSHEDVEQIMGFPYLNLTDDGWTSEYRTELLFPNPAKAYRNIYGFKINFKLAKISFLLTKDKQNAYSSGNLFDTNDIKEIFSNGMEPNLTLSLDSPDFNLRSHPFKHAKFTSSNSKLRNSCDISQLPNLYLTLSRAAMLLCYFSSGLEVCSKSPFHMKRTDEGLLLRLEEHLQHILRPARTRKDESDKAFGELDIPNRFWLNMTEVFEEEEEDDKDESLVYKVGDVKAQVKMNTLILTLNGTKASLTPEAEFARDFTKHFDEIGQFFPELLRLKELVKISLICKKLKQILREKVIIMKQNGKSKDEINKIANVCKAIRDLGICLEEDEEQVKSQKNATKDCTWFPATFCNNFDPEIYEVSAGVRVIPDVTYFPVSVPKDCQIVTAKELFAKKLSLRRF